MNTDTDAMIQELSGQDIQEMLDSVLGDNSFSFTQYISDIVNGKMHCSVQEAGSLLLQGILSDLQQQKGMYLFILLLAVMGAVITNLSRLLQGKQVAETAFYGVYMLFFAVLTSAFAKVSLVAVGTLTDLVDFMKVLTPSYFISMTFAQGATASTVYYEFFLVVITVANVLLVKLSIPVIHVFFLLKIANELSEEEMFSKMAELLYDFLKMALKTVLGIVMGINVIQGLIVPVSAEVERSVWVKAGSALPGVGNTISTVSGTLLCAARLVKNAVGITGVLAIVLLCGIPLLKLIVWKFGYQLVAAVVQPVSDQRVIRCLGAVSQAVELLIRAVATGAMLFILSILIICTMTT